MDYRLWIKGGNWEEFDEAALREIDQAVAWGAKYGIHVSINFHRAPGYTVASPPEKTSLWTDRQTQRVCAKHWAMFARRYRGVPSAAAELQPDERAGQCRAGGLRGGGPQAGRGHPRRRPGSADHLRWPAMGHGSRAGTARTPHRPGHTRLHAHGDQPLQGKLGQQRELPLSAVAALAAAQRHPAQPQEGGGLLSAGDRRPLCHGYRVAAARADGFGLRAAGGGGRRQAGLPEAVPMRPRQGRMEESRVQEAVADLPESLRPRLHGHDSRRAPGRSAFAWPMATGWKSARSG